MKPDTLSLFSVHLSDLSGASSHHRCLDLHGTSTMRIPSIARAHHLLLQSIRLVRANEQALECQWNDNEIRTDTSQKRPRSARLVDSSESMADTPW